MADRIAGRFGGREATRRWAPRGVTAIVVCTAAASTLLYSGPANRILPIGALLSAVVEDSRALEPRLSGMPWAPFRVMREGNREGGSHTAVLQALVERKGDATPSMRHLTGVAELLTGRGRKSLTTLASTAESTNAPEIWSDLSAALYDVSAQYKSPQMLADALGASDAALALREMPEALFNRALILQRLGLRDDAREAWNRYLSVERNAGWLAEGQQHLREVEAIVWFKDAVDTRYDRLLRDPSAPRQLVEQQREDARSEGAIEILGRWAAAELRHDRAGAKTHLGFARALGSEIRRVEADRMLERAVDLVDAADDARLGELAQAQHDYSGGVTIFRKNNPTEAEPMLRRAVAAFERAGSPLVWMARYYLANTLFDQGRREDALAILKRVAAEAPLEFPAARAHALAQIGACHFTRSEWGESIRALEESSAAFERLGETTNVAAAQRLMAIVYDQTGDSERAWTHRMVALAGLGRQSNLRLEKLVSSIAQEAMLRHNWRTAAAFLNLEVAIARRLGDDVHLVETLIFRAAVRHRLNDADGVQADITDANARLGPLKDPGYRNHLQATSLGVQAMLTASPAEAGRLLTEAIAFESTRGDERDIPRLLLQRARARRAVRDSVGARADLDHGLQELETARGSLPSGEPRWGAFQSGEELFEEAIDLALEDGDTAKAFAVAEKARARTLLETVGGQPPARGDRPPRDTVLVEYAALPSRLVIFTVDGSGVHSTIVPVDRASLARFAGELTATLQRPGDDSRRPATALWKQLIAPIAADVARFKSLVVVPDVALSTIPFVALMNEEGRYLTETHSVVVSPSAAVFAALAARRAAMGPPRSLLVISSSLAYAEGGSLLGVTRETGQITRFYTSPVRLEDKQAEFAELERAAPAADVIHFGGHAIGDDSGLDPASLILQKDGKAQHVGVSAIGRLRLTHTSVVVLAGCSTARGNHRGTEGVVSVARGFLIAGAPSVIATLWPIDDGEAAIAFPRIHALLASGVSPAEAVRQVQIQAIRDGMISPSLWAALQVIGS